MRLKDQFQKVLSEATKSAEEARYQELLPKIEQHRNIFMSGIGQNVLKVGKDGRISYSGEIEFDHPNDSETTLPFSFKKVGLFSMYSGYPDKLESLDGLPEECANFEFILKTDKPSSFFEGKFPKKIHDSLFIAAPNLKNCKFGVEQLGTNARVSIRADVIHSLEGLPNQIDFLYFDASLQRILSFEGLPKNIRRLVFSGERDEPFDITNIAKHAGEITNITTYSDKLVTNTPILAAFKIKGLNSITNPNSVGEAHEVFKIVNQHLSSGDILSCQDELIDAGFEQYARTK